jgi:hypothetical protein
MRKIRGFYFTSLYFFTVLHCTLLKKWFTIHICLPWNETYEGVSRNLMDFVYVRLKVFSVMRNKIG